MSGANGYFTHQYPGIDPRQSTSAMGQNFMDSSGMSGMDTSLLDEGQSLDDLINQNNQELQRRRDTLSHYPTSHAQDPTIRRASMMEFGSLNDDLADFQFDPSPANPMLGQMENTMPTSQKSVRKPKSRENTTSDMKFPGTMGDLNNMPDFSSPVDFTGNMTLDTSAQYPMGDTDMNMDFVDASGEVTPMNIQSGMMDTALYSQSPQQNFIPSFSAPGPDSSMGANASNDPGAMVNFPQGRQAPVKGRMQSDMSSETVRQSQNTTMNALARPQRPQQPTSSQDVPPIAFGISNGDSYMNGVDGQGVVGPSASPYANAYSSSGFDMLGVLHDLPIVYCSDVFERLTGYNKHEILGRNCRFLQAPDGKVQAGVKRRFVEDKSVLQIKNRINARSEVQLSLINYRKGGQPFMNLLTMIPIPWDDDEFKYYVGFQVDLVDNPNSVSGRNPDGTFAINYQRSQLPRYTLPAPESNPGLPDLGGQTIARDEVSTVLATIANGESELSRRIWDKVLLENTDDVVHVLSLKGLFLYLSPACRKVLEYDVSELVGTALSSVCHPSDIVPVTRELKDTSSTSSVNVVYRIRRKHSGYTWFEAHGSLHTEQGKGRKCIILVGRERPVYAINKNTVAQYGGIGDSELWTKMSTSGMFLFISSNVRALLDRMPDELIGTGAQSLMRKDSQAEFGRALDLARCGRTSTFNHDMQNKRGQTLQAQTTLYPGDAEEGSKPTFVVAQTRFSKMSRSLLTKRQPALSPRTDAASAGSVTPSTNQSAQSTAALSRRGSFSQQQHPTPADSAMTHAGSGGLVIGNQSEALASEENIFDELKTTRSTSWQFELRQMEKQNRLLAEELQGLLARKKKRKRRKGPGMLQKDCANCHTRVTPEWRRGPSGNRDLCNSCGLRWAKQNGRVSPRKTSSEHGSDKKSASPAHSSPMARGDSLTPIGGVQNTLDSHISKAPRVESVATATASASAAGYEAGVMIPPKIEEAVEPIDDFGLPGT
ncbi:MAG: hypothetical protein Q9160_000820 [Pyrenula sp. 1 TL-2023]